MVTLCALIFVGPMVLVARIAGVALSPADVGLFVAYAVMQEGIILVNTAEDLPEDEAAGVRTSAVALGLSNAVSLAGAMVGFGGVALVAALAIRIAAPIGLVGLAPLVVACVWVFDSLNTTWMRGRGRSRDEAMVHVRASARAMPLWITATAWTTLFAALVLATGWGT